MSFFKSVQQAFGFGYDRPSYEVVQKIDNTIEVRKYAPTKWVCTKVKTEFKESKERTRSMFFKLFDYISGENEAKQKIAMTVPVTSDFKVDDNQILKLESGVEMTMRFFIADGLDPPKPTGDAYLVEDPEMTAAVIKFGGYATTEDYINYRNILIDKLGDEAKNYDQVNIMTAGYNPPFQPIGRTNEVWLRKIR